MIKLSYDEIVEKIVGSTGLNKQEIEDKINQKIKDLDGLVSKEGAAHIIAHECGIKIFDIKKSYKLNELVEGSRVDVAAKLVQKYGTREYSKENRTGKVANILVGDETSLMRVVFWDENLITKLDTVKEEDVLKFKNAFVKRNNNFKELHLGSGTDFIVNPPGESIGEVSLKSVSQSVKKKISELQEGDNVEIYGTIVDFFEPRFYEACPECNKKVILNDGKFYCNVHGKVIEKMVPIVNIFFDDGTDNIRVVFFREIASNFLGVSSSELYSFKGDAVKLDEIRKKILGKQLKIIGRVNKNEMFSRLEITGNNFFELDPIEVAKELTTEV